MPHFYFLSVRVVRVSFLSVLVFCGGKIKIRIPKVVRSRDVIKNVSTVGCDGAIVHPIISSHSLPPAKRQRLQTLQDIPDKLSKCIPRDSRLFEQPGFEKLVAQRRARGDSASLSRSPATLYIAYSVNTRLEVCP